MMPPADDDAKSFDRIQVFFDHPVQRPPVDPPFVKLVEAGTQRDEIQTDSAAGVIASQWHEVCYDMHPRH